jgi:hypothetical protein
MVMKAMLIGLLVIASVAMLETAASAYHCPPGIACPRFVLPKDSEKTVANYGLSLPKDLEKVIADYKKDESGRQLLIVGYFNRPMNSKEHDSMSHKMDAMRERLIQHGVRSDSIREVMLEGCAPNGCKRRGQIVVYLR